MGVCRRERKRKMGRCVVREGKRVARSEGKSFLRIAEVRVEKKEEMRSFHARLVSRGKKADAGRECACERRGIVEGEKKGRFVCEE